ncbi:MAG TPA: GTP-binding protein [Vicinamibacterales bacterium]|nr:GTP-binding protein [Vicinamibacterales bacterium]
MSIGTAFVVVGHVDHGKSTLVGRLLADTDSLPVEKIDKVRRICAEQRKPFEHAFLLDALEAEQLQGVTIDVTEVQLTWQERTFVLIDAPGHKEFLRNMISGAAHADAAFLLIDAGEGVQEQSYRHAYLLSFLGVRDVAVIVSKMDLVGYSQDVFEAIRKEYTAFLDTIGVHPKAFIPISAREGDNVVTRSPRIDWYDGPAVLELLAAVDARVVAEPGPLRLPVQDVYKFDHRRIVAGRLESGRVSPGDEIQVFPSGHRARVKSIEAWPEGPDRDVAAARDTTGITLDYQLFVQRGDVIADPQRPPHVSSFLTANVFWLGRAPLELRRRYKLKLATLERDVEVSSITRVMSAVTLEVQTDRTGIGQNEAGEVVFRSARPFVFDVASDVPTMGRFVLLDGYDVVGGGIVLESDDIYRRPYREGMPKSADISLAQGGVTPADRAEAYGHRSHVVWLTGMPGTGKSTVSRRLEWELFQRQIKAFVLDGENLRFGLSADLDFSAPDRLEHARRAAEVARLFQSAGLVVVVALASPFEAAREYARELVGDEAFTLVHLHAPMATLLTRDPHGLYSRGVSVPYEIPASPSMAFDTSLETPDAVVDKIVRRVLAKI